MRSLHRPNTLASTIRHPQIDNECSSIAGQKIFVPKLIQNICGW